MSVRASEPLLPEHTTCLWLKTINDFGLKIYLRAHQSRFFALEFLRQSPRCFERLFRRLQTTKTRNFNPVP